MNDEEQNLNIMSEADNYNNWIYNNIKEHIGDDVLEIGSGVGAMTKYFDDRELCCVDINDKHIKALEEKYKSYTNIKIVKTDISRNFHNIKKQFDTVLCINILEHVEDDLNMLINIYNLVKQGGKFVLVLPAFQSIYGTIDEADNHYRRYNKKDIKKVLDIAKFKDVNISYTNMAGFFGWYYHGKVLKIKTHNKGDISLFDKLVPLFAKVEKIIIPRFGLSMIVVCKK